MGNIEQKASQAIGNQGDGYIARPISDRELLARGEAMLRIRQTEDALQKRTKELRERVKELDCLYGISHLIERPGVALEEIFQEVLELLPPAWQYPEIACARIVLDSQEFRTADFRETVWRQACNIVVHGKPAGMVEVCYLEEGPEIDEGPFLAEERRLLSAIAERLGRITERMRAEEALKRSEERYALAQRVSNIGSWDWNVQSGDLHWSDRIEPMFGFGRGEFGATYEAFLDCVHPADRQVVIDSVNACLEEGVDYAIEHRIVWPDGTVRWISETGDVIRDQNGQAIRMLGIVQDITERKLAERSLRRAKEEAEAARREEQERRRESERRRQIAESLGDVLTVLNSNRSLDEVLDYIAVQAGQLLGTRAAGIYGLERETGVLAVQAATGLLVTYVAGADIPIGQDALRRAMATHQPVAVPDLAATQVGDGEVALRAEDWRRNGFWTAVYRALLAVPIVVQGEVDGGMLLYYAEPRSFSDEEVELAMAFGDQVALAIENAQLRERVRQTATIAERDRLARELHDAVTQTLFSASLIAEAIPRIWERDPEEGRRGLEELRQLTRGAAAEMRTMLLELRPAALTEKPLKELLRHLTEAMTGRTRIPIALTAASGCILPPDVQIALYRITQEALNNVAKHASADQASVRLDCQPSSAMLCVRDDGCGFDPDDILPDQLGLGIMRERAKGIGATLEIDSRPGYGTRIVVNWPHPAGRG